MSSDRSDTEIACIFEQMTGDIVAINSHDLATLLPVLECFERLAQIGDETTGAAEIRAIAERGQVVITERFAEPVLDEAMLIGDLAEVLQVLQALAEGDALAEMNLPGAFADGPGCGPSSQRLVRELQLPDHVDPLILGEFVERLHAGANEIEEYLVRIERADDNSIREQAAGCIHTLKGEAGVLGLDDLLRLLHRLEDSIQGEAVLQIDAMLAAVDWMRTFAAYAGGRQTRPVNLDVLLRRLDGSESDLADGADDHELLPEPSGDSAYKGQDPLTDAARQRQRPPEELAEFLGEANEHLEIAEQQLLAIEAGDHDKEALNTLFRSFHTIKGLAGFVGTRQVQSIAHESESLLDHARQGAVPVGACTDLVFEAVDLIRQQQAELTSGLAEGQFREYPVDLTPFLSRIKGLLRGDPPDAGECERTAADPRRFTADLVRNAGISPRSITATVRRRKVDTKDATALARALVEEGVVSAGKAARAIRAARQGSGEAKVAVKESVKVDAERLDRLIDLIGELVIAQTMVTQSPELGDIGTSQLGARLGQVDKLTRELQELGTGLRMVPVRGAFTRMARLVRDLSRKLNKPVEFVTIGEDTELDKNVVDRIGDPLVHMVRNAIDHGLEAGVEERRAAGKDETGRIELRAFHKGGNIYIEIEDDGRGLDRARILAKARDRGLVEPDQQPSDREIFQLIFHPGFSTAQEVSDVSGRGVGMDVVKRSIDALRGQVEISSTPGQGTCFSIRLPLTLAVIDGMIVRIGAERYIIPTLSIVSSLRPSQAELVSCMRRGEMLRWQGELLPLTRLSRIFEVPGAATEPTEALCVIVEEEDRQIALLVDELLGQQQVVIKALGAAMQRLRGLSGGAILPDGTVGLIIDVMTLTHLANDHHQQHRDAKAFVGTEP